MPVDVLVASTICNDRYWEVEHQYSESGVSASNGIGFNAGGSSSETYIIRTDNALASPSVVPKSNYTDYVNTAGVQVNTLHSETVGTGDEVTITLPTTLAQWGSLNSIGYLIKGLFTAQHTIVSNTRMTVQAQMVGGSNRVSGSVANVYCRPKTPGAGQNWVAWEWWQNYVCGSSQLVNGREPYVARQRYAVCDANYLKWNQYDPNTGFGDFAGATEAFIFRGAEELDIAAFGGTETGGHAAFDSAKIRAWAIAKFGTTDTLNMQMFPPQFPASELWVRDYITPGASSSRSITTKTRYTMQGFQLLINFGFGGSNAPQTSYNNVGLDCFDDVVACAWCTAPNGGKKQVLIGVNRSVLKNTGSGSGSTGGWDIHNWGDVDERSPIGFGYLPNGWLILTYNTYDGSGNPTARFVVNKKHGLGPFSNWSAPDTLSPNAAQALGWTRGMGQAGRVRVG